METIGFSFLTMDEDSALNSRIRHICLKPCIAIIAAVLGTVSGTVAEERELSFSSSCILSPNPAYAPLCAISIPFMVNHRELSFHTADSGPAFSFLYARFQLFSETGLAVDSAALALTIRQQGEPGESGRFAFGELSLLTSPGRYTGRLTLLDRATGKSGEWFFPALLIPSPTSSRLVIGGGALGFQIRLVDSVESGMPMTQIRNGVDLQVNPLSLFSTTDSMMAFYSECYNLLPSADDSVRYQFGVDILATDGSIALPFGSARRAGVARSVVISRELDVSVLPAGNFLLRLVVADLQSNQVDSILLPFRRQVPLVVSARPEAARVDTGSFAALPLQDQWQSTFHWLEPSQRNVRAELNDSGLANYLRQFWADQELQVGKAPGELRNMAADRYAFSNEHFSSEKGKGDGWRNDRGRVYILYGPWELRDDRSVPQATAPYDIWYYKSIRDGLVFVFVDARATQEYRLVHSNARGERFDDDWDSLIKQYFR